MNNIRSNIISIILFLIYLIFLIWVIIFKFQIHLDDLPNYQSLNLNPFFIEGQTNPHIYSTELYLNFIIFIPFGLYLSMIFRNMSIITRILIIFCTSLGIEITQYYFEIGAADINDLITNTLGGVFGIIIYYIIYLIFKHYTQVTLNIISVIITCLIIASSYYFLNNIYLIF